MTTEEDSDVFAALRVLTFFLISLYLESFSISKSSSDQHLEINE